MNGQSSLNGGRDGLDNGRRRSARDDRNDNSISRGRAAIRTDNGVDKDDYPNDDRLQSERDDDNFPILSDHVEETTMASNDEDDGDRTGNLAIRCVRTNNDPPQRR